jgi:hypothetical protein
LYQDFVGQLVCWHQHQRSRDAKGRLIALPEDLKAAAELMFDSIVLKVDELDGSLRHFFERLKDYVEKRGGEGYFFTQLEVRQALNCSKSALQRHFYELQSLEYLRIADGNPHRGYRYKIAYWDDYQLLRTKIKDYLNKQIFDLD